MALSHAANSLSRSMDRAFSTSRRSSLINRNELLPTVHGFDEFYGDLYHLNAEEEPELPDYPKDPAFRAKSGPRGVMDCKAIDKDEETVDARFAKVGKQTIKDTGPLTRKRMETIDDDVANRAADFIQRQARADKPFLVWVNFTHMHFRTHVKPESKGQSGRWMGEYADVMIDHDKTGVHGTAGTGDIANMVRAVYDTPRAEDVQPASGPVRASRYHVKHLLRLAARPRLPAGAGAGLCGQVPDDAQGLPAAAEGREL